MKKIKINNKRKNAVTVFFSAALILMTVINSGCSTKKEDNNTSNPNKTNKPEKTQVNNEPSDVKLYINEYMSSNAYINCDIDNDAHNWVEIYNPTDKDIDLENCMLSDDKEEINKFVFPKMQIKAGGYVTVFLSGKTADGAETKEMHANFSIKKGEIMILSDSQNKLIDSMIVDEHPEHISIGRSIKDVNKLVYYTKPTPEQKNVEEEYQDINTANSLKTKGIWINEVSAISLKKEAALDGKEVKEWIEIYNGTNETVDLNDYGITDSMKEPYKHKFINTKIEPGQYLTVYATGISKVSGNEIQVPFKIKGGGDNIYLVSKEGYIIDDFETGYQKLGVTSGRKQGSDSSEVFYYAKATLGAANSEIPYAEYGKDVEFSANGGNVSAGTSITLSSKQEGAVIRYTVDGSEPDESSQVYSAPIVINENMSLRARTYSQNTLPGNTVTRTFLTDAPHDIPVVCLSTRDDYLFDKAAGIYENYSSSEEKPVHFEYYTEKGERGIGFDAGISLHGQYSRTELQKSFSIDLRDAYGKDEVTYPFFRDFDINVFKSILLRTSGQDWGITKVKDAFCAQIIKGQMDVDYMEYRPVAVYINGDYWGLYNIREKIDKDYVTAHTGIEDDDMDLIKANRNVKEGDMTQMNALREYFKNNNMADAAAYEYVSSKMDIQNHIDYWITVSYLNNTDSGNIRYYNDKSGNHKWRWIMFDFDWALYKSTYNVYDNMVIDRLLAPGHGIQEMFDNTFNLGLFKNAEYKDRFLTEYGKRLKTTFAPDRCIEILDKMTAQIDNEMKRHTERWGKPSSYEVWKRNIEGSSNTTGLKDILRERPEIAKQQLKRRFGLSDAEMQKYFG